MQWIKLSHVPSLFSVPVISFSKNKVVLLTSTSLQNFPGSHIMDRLMGLL